MKLSTGLLLCLWSFVGFAQIQVLENGDILRNGKVVVEQTDQGKRHYHYNEKGFVAWIQEPDGSKTTFKYDRKERRTEMVTRFYMVTYNWNDQKRVMTKQVSGNGITMYHYEGRLLERIFTSNSLVMRFVHDEMDRLSYLEVYNQANEILQSFEYTFDANGNRKTVLEHDGRFTEYAYDALDRLIREEITETNGQLRYWEYRYDEVGNRIAMSSNGVVTTYEYDDNDRMIRAGDEQFTYDDNGSMTSKTVGGNTTTYAYNARQRLAQVTFPDGQTLDFDYDFNGNRIRAGSRHFSVDTNRIFPEVIDERNSAGQVTFTYSHAGDWDPVRFIRSQEGNFYPLYDGHRNVTAVTDQAGKVVSTYRYDAFGNLISSTGSAPCRYLYSGEEFDEATGFYYLRARYYLPKYGRFLTMDSWQGNPLDPRTLNKYVYALNNPVNGIDPLGTWTLSEINSAFVIGSNVQTAAVYAINLATGNYAVVAGDAAMDIALTMLGGPFGKLASASGKTLRKFGNLFKKRLPGKLKLGHPEASSKVLSDNLKALGIQKPPNTQAHHIIPGKLGDRGRKILEKHDIDINSPINGVFLPGKGPTDAVGTIHSGRHTDEYVRYVENAIQAADARGGKMEVLRTMAELKGRLLSGQLQLNKVK